MIKVKEKRKVKNLRLSEKILRCVCFLVIMSGLIFETFEPILLKAITGYPKVINILAIFCVYCLGGIIVYILLSIVFKLCNILIRQDDILSPPFVIVVFLISSIVLYNSIVVPTDMSEATIWDYNELEEQIKEVETKKDLFDKSGSFACNEDGKIVATFENNECKIIVYYDKEFNIYKKEYLDKCIGYWFTFYTYFIIELSVMILAISFFVLSNYLKQRIVKLILK